MPSIKHLGLAALLAGSAVALAGCDEGYGYGVDAGYGPGYYDAYYDGYASPYYDYPGYGLGYYGWYGGYYYPGSGVYVYDRFRRPLRWNGDQRRYWHGQLNGYRGNAGGRSFARGPNWGGFNRGAGSGARPPAGQAFRGGAAPAGAHGFGGGGAGRGGWRHR